MRNESKKKYLENLELDRRILHVLLNSKADLDIILYQSQKLDAKIVEFTKSVGSNSK